MIPNTGARDHVCTKEREGGREGVRGREREREPSVRGRFISLHKLYYGFFTKLPFLEKLTGNHYQETTMD